MKKLLFISHDAHLAGAQILLLNLLKWLKENHSDKIKFDVLLAGGGNLTVDFESIATVYKVPLQKKEANVFEKIMYKLKLIIFYNQINHKHYDLIYNNTFSNGKLLNILKHYKVPVITHVHELEYWIKKNGIQNQNYIKDCTHYYLTASSSVQDYLLANHIATSDNVEVVYEWIDSAALLSQNNKKSIKVLLNLSEDAIIIAASGHENFRKGKDWFVPVAIQVLYKFNTNNIHFVWIGGQTSEELVFDFEKSGFRSNIHFIEHMPNASAYFHEFEIFMMLSREDPFPLVNLEVAIWEVPVVCFQNAGGTEELISDNCGLAVPYGNLNMFSETIIKLIENKKLKNEIGKNIKEKVIKEFDINVVGEKILKAIFKVSKENE